MKNYYKLCLLMLSIVGSLHLSAQNIVSGQVFDSEGESLIGATVTEMNQNIGTTTDIDGNFSISVNKLPTSLSVSYLGYVSQVILVETEGQMLTINLAENVSRLDEIVIVGSRGKSRTVLTSPVPIDNLNAAELLKSGQTTVDQMINYRVPSYNSTNQTVADATAHFDPSELRNMGPSRTLVLINGKRKNQSALVYVNDTPGKGEVGTDMKSIPVGAIERVEVLRDGAAAQYGSDAVAGVINVVLKKGYEGNVTLGSGITQEGDGLFYEASVNKGFAVGKGYFNITGNYYHQDETNRAGEPGADELFGVDGTNAWIQENPDLGMTVGQPEYDKYSIFSNFGLPYSDGKGEFYAFGGYTRRNGTSYALYRPPYWITDDAGLLTPDGEEYGGFQPTFETGINDFSISIGNRYNISNWNTDISLTSGGSSIDYTIGNTINTDLLPNSPTDFDAGAYAFGNLIGNLDISRSFDKITVSVGTEARSESFKVTAGQEESYVESGAQSFPGLQPSNALDESRTNVGVYGGLDFDVTETFLVGGAVRFENYSDFGSNFSWKLNARQLFGNKRGAIRASVSTGFRAPSLHQIYLSNVQTLVSGGTISNQGTFNNVSPVIQSLGIPPLDAETSFNITGGVTYKLLDNLSITADYYNIKLDDRVLFTGEIGADDDPNTTNAVETILNDNAITSIKFFVNAMDTRTQGFDLVLDYQGIKLGDKTKLGALFSLNKNETKILNDNITSPGTIGELGYEIFNRKEQSRVTTARPNLKALLGLNLDVSNFNIGLNNTYFGEVTWQHADDPAKDQIFSGKVITDLLLGYNVSDKIRINASINNLLDVYPDEIDTKGDVVTDLGGRFKYAWEVNQFGFNGRTFKIGASIGF